MLDEGDTVDRNLWYKGDISEITGNSVERVNGLTCDQMQEEV
jgi:hypothetical protein